MITAGLVLDRALRAAGVDAVYGQSLAGVRTVPIRDPTVAVLAARAHQRVHGTLAAAHIGDGRLVIGAVGGKDAAIGAPGGPRELMLDDPADAVEAVAAMAAGHVVVRVVFDPASSTSERRPWAAPAVDRWVDPDADQLRALAAARNPVALAGPGVVRDRAVPGLNAFATAGSLGVLNTWGAKGVFDWRSRHHWATIGLQARDFEMGGLGTADLIIATGLDVAESPPERWQLAPSIVLAPGALGPTAERWGRARVELEVPPLRAGLAAVTQEGWAASSGPLAPTRATLNYGRCFGTGGLVAADPGVAGYWVARTFSTTELGSAQVPAESENDGFAVACGLVARLRRPGRPVLAAIDGPPGELVGAALEAAASLGVAVPVEVWDPDGPLLDPDAHLDRLERLVFDDRPLPVHVATDPSQLGRMIDVAGPIVAWNGLATGGRPA